MRLSQRKSSKIQGLALVIAILVSLQIFHIFTASVIPYSPICTESTAGNLTLRTPTYHDLSFAESESGVSESDLHDATCRFRSSSHTHHFPHAMQQLYQCWSYWKLHPLKRHVLIIPKEAKGFPGGPLNWRDRVHILMGTWWTSFLEGFVDVVRFANVSVVETAPGPFVERQDRANTFYMHDSQDAVLLRDTAHALYNIVPSAGCHNNMPRVSILSREATQSRRILNADELSRAIRSKLNITNTIPISQFERASFRDQVQVFADADIVISSHGAQLTGIPFLHVCARVLELFPARYYFDGYFGSLADASGIAHYGLYLSQGDPQMEWQKTLQLDSLQRRIYRTVNLCPPVDAIVDAVARMTADWKHCCTTQQNSHAAR